MAPTGSFTAQIGIAVPRDAVWRALTLPAGRRRWMNDAEVVSSWGPGDEVTIEVVLEGQVRRDLGTVEVSEPPELLRYSLWSSISRRSDRPEHRSTVTFRLTPTSGGGTLLALLHEDLGAATAVPHAAFFWPVALAVLRDDLEGRPPGSLTLGERGA